MLRNVTLFTGLLALPLFGGGFWLEFGNPKASTDPKAKDAVLLVRPLGCHNPTRAAVTGTAEGVVNGRRQSVPLHIVALSSPGVYAVKREWPVEGSWVLAFTATEGELATGAVVDIAGGRRSVKSVMRKPTPGDIAEALGGTN